MKSFAWAVVFLLRRCHAFYPAVGKMWSRPSTSELCLVSSSPSSRLEAAAIEGSDPSKVKNQRPPRRSFLSLSKSVSSFPDGQESLDVEALTKYGAALAIQISLFYGLFLVMDQVVTNTGSNVPYWANIAFFYAMSLRSRLFNPLSNKRPNPKTFEIEGQEGQEQTRNMPTWTPPGVVFPVMWILIIAPIRAVTATMVYGATQSYADPAIMALAVHLSIGDVWNTINNVEKRYGAAVPGVLCVWLTKAWTAYQFYQVVPLAGQIMVIPLLWLTVASTLVTRIWQLNPDAETGEIEPLYPVVGKASSNFTWFG